MLVEEFGSVRGFLDSLEIASLTGSNAGNNIAPAYILCGEEAPLLTRLHILRRNTATSF
jgi:hypothetical protein